MRERSTTPPSYFERGELAALQLLLPFTLPKAVQDWLQNSKQLGRGVTLCNETSHQHIEHSPRVATLHLFDKQRLFDESSLFSPGKELTHMGFLPIGGCGNRGREVCVVGTRGEHEGRLLMWRPSSDTLQALDLHISQLVSCPPSTGTQLRRRLPGTVRSIKPVPAPKKKARRTKLPPLSAAARTLSLFAEI